MKSWCWCVKRMSWAIVSSLTSLQKEGSSHIAARIHPEDQTLTTAGSESLELLAETLSCAHSTSKGTSVLAHYGFCSRR